MPKTCDKFSATHRETNKKIVQAIHCEPVKEEGIFQDTRNHRNQDKTGHRNKQEITSEIEHIYFTQLTILSKPGGW